MLGRGVAVPIAVVFLGAIGGFVTMGIIGLFVGAIVLSVGYNLFLAWIEPGRLTAQPKRGQRGASSTGKNQRALGLILPSV
jgi:predicted PurR-regulated permease PerM